MTEKITANGDTGFNSGENSFISLYIKVDGDFDFTTTLGLVELDGTAHSYIDLNKVLTDKKIKNLKLTKDNAEFIEKQVSRNLLDFNSIIDGYYASENDFKELKITKSSKYNTPPKIKVTVGVSYRRVNIGLSLWVYLYDTNGKPLRLLQSLVDPVYTVEEGVGYIQTLINPSSTFAMVIVDGEDESFVPFETRYKLSRDIIIDNESKPALLENPLGFLTFQNIGESDYSQIIMYGQSLSMGWEAPEAISTQNVKGNWMVGDKVEIRHGNNGQNVLKPLISTMANACGENPIVAAVNSFSTLWRRFRDVTTQFIASSCGEGGQSIETLSKECTNRTNYYREEFISVLDRTKLAVNNLDKTVECNAIIFMQGEHNYIGSGLGIGVGTEATKDKDIYKTLLTTLKNNMQNDIMTKYGQNHRPLFFIYQTAGIYINRLDMSINMAQVEFAEENEDVFLLNSTYFTPDYGGGHLSTNGYRWYGEMIGKSMYDVFLKGLRAKPIIPVSYRVDNNKIVIEFEIPNPPLVIDNYTKEPIESSGFEVLMNGNNIVITRLSIDEHTIILETNSKLSGDIELIYAGKNRGGSGNLRDSDNRLSMYTYYDDRITSPLKRESYTPKNVRGTLMYGNPYPMYNWCCSFYKKVII